MDDLSINIAGFAPAAVRTAAASLKASFQHPQSTGGKRDRIDSSKKRKLDAPAKQSTAAPNNTSGGATARAETSRTHSGTVEFGSSKDEAAPLRKKKRSTLKSPVLGQSLQPEITRKPARVQKNEVVSSTPRAAEEQPKKKQSMKAKKLAKGQGSKAKRKVLDVTAGSPDSMKQDGVGSETKFKVKKPLQGQGSKAKRQEINATASSDSMKQSGVGSETDFKALKLHERLVKQLDYLGYKTCTPVQALGIPRAMSGTRDVLLRAPTGSGKTLAFLLPVFHVLLSLPAGSCDRSKGTLAVILSPTKELALQTLKVASNLARMLPHLVCGSVAGGEKPKSEKASLRKGVGILCATPGRLTYHLDHTATLNISNIRCLVLDEADRLLDMGFEPQVRKIHRLLVNTAQNEGTDVTPQKASEQRVVQTLLVSATLVPAVRKLAEFCLRPKAFWADPDSGSAGSTGTSSEQTAGRATVAIGEELSFSTPSTLTQWYCVVPARERLTALMGALLSRVGKKKSIVFFSTGASVDFHCDLLLDATWPSRGGVQRHKDSGPAIKKKGKFIGLASDKSFAGGDDDDDDGEDEDDEDAAKDSTTDASASNTGTKIFSKTQLFKLHGSLTAEERAGYIADFSNAPGGILLASDAASRGLDFPQIDWIIQFDPPQRTEEYLHRVGRTARIGREGNALLFLQPSELGFLDALRGRGLKQFREMNPEDLSSGLRRTAPEELLRIRDLPGVLAGHLASRVEDCAPLASRARSAFLSSLKAYRSFPRELRPCFPYGQLHVGHLASSFALREAPAQISKRERHERLSASDEQQKGEGNRRGPKGKGKGRRPAGKGGNRGGKDDSKGKNKGGGRLRAHSAENEFAS
eukprot:TRINITY_DN4158_c0_g1_i1.p1 TRINITY_DN4158_c0_g1~~TRINITY_DN4158_c0_g1_i1.p1  ORF type:complete len:866 (-),score=181.62 TRINITY_DN4158_c0_g1_i1:41-2638(-)